MGADMPHPMQKRRYNAFLVTLACYGPVAMVVAALFALIV
jgi:hypothetical protein